MADKKKKKKKEKSLMDSARDAYNSAAKSGYLGAKAQVTVTERSKKKSKSK